MCVGVEGDGQIDQSRFDFKWAGKKQKTVRGLHEEHGSGTGESGWRRREMAEHESDEKLQIIKNGRPTPELELKEKVKKVERHFKTENDQRYPWMTGCKKTSRMYCWSVSTVYN